MRLREGRGEGGGTLLASRTVSASVWGEGGVGTLLASRMHLRGGRGGDIACFEDGECVCVGGGTLLASRMVSASACQRFEEEGRKRRES